MAAVDLADDVRSDADLVVSWAIEAIDGDRLDLAAELIVLARRLRHGATAAPLIAPAGRVVAVPLDGATHTELPHLAAPEAICQAREDGDGRQCRRAIYRTYDGRWAHGDPEVLDHDADPGPQAD